MDLQTFPNEYIYIYIYIYNYIYVCVGRMTIMQTVYIVGYTNIQFERHCSITQNWSVEMPNTIGWCSGKDLTISCCSEYIHLMP